MVQQKKKKKVEMTFENLSTLYPYLSLYYNSIYKTKAE